MVTLRLMPARTCCSLGVIATPSRTMKKLAPMPSAMLPFVSSSIARASGFCDLTSILAWTMLM